MAKYLDDTGLRTLWTKIKETFVAQKIKKSSDSNNATSIVHNGQRVSLSTGKIMSQIQRKCNEEGFITLSIFGRRRD